MPFEVFAVLVIVAFIVIAGPLALYQNRFDVVPEPWRSRLLDAFADGYEQPARRPILSICHVNAGYFRQRYKGRLQPLRQSLQPIAITQNASNEALRVARVETIVALMDTFDQVTQTKAIKAVFGISPSSTNAEYAAIVAAIKAAQQHRKDTAKFTPLTDDQRTFRRSVGLKV